MEQMIFTIYDNKAKAFLKPFFTRNSDTAIRSIMETITRDKNHEFTRYASDYELYQLGSYDDNTGKLDTYPPAHIINLNQLQWGDAPDQGTANEQQVKDLDHKTVAEEALKAVN